VFIVRLFFLHTTKGLAINLQPFGWYIPMLFNVIQPMSFLRRLYKVLIPEAVQALLEAQPGTPTYMIGLQENKIMRVPLMDAVESRDGMRLCSFKSLY
jgi:hypothetical protein